MDWFLFNRDPRHERVKRWGLRQGYTHVAVKNKSIEIQINEIGQLSFHIKFLKCNNK